MPKKYEAIKEKFMKEGMGEDEAQTRAAKIYNAQRKRGQKPVTRYVEEGGKIKKKK